MITNKEMFCTLLGAISMVNGISSYDKTTIVKTAGKKWGLSESDMSKDITDMEMTLTYIVENIRENKRERNFEV